MKNIKEFTQEEIINSKTYVKGYANYPAPYLFLADVLNIEKEKYNMNLKATHEVINLNEDGTKNISFGRIDLSYKFQIDEELSYKIGIVLAIDKGKPIAKIYTGVQVNACLNMCIFSADQIITIDLSSNFFSFLERFKEQFKEVDAKVQKSIKMIKALKKMDLSSDKCKFLNGAILQDIIYTNSEAGIMPITNAIRLQSDENCKYFAKNGLNAWQYFNSTTEYLDKKIHIFDIPNKAFNLFNCLNSKIEINQKPITEIEAKKKVSKKNKEIVLN